MKRPETTLLTHSEIASLVTFEGAIEAVEDVMKAHGRGQVIAPDLLHANSPQGEFHIKTGGVLKADGTGVFGLKANGGFFGNRALGLPNIVGVIYLAESQTGCPLAVLDSVEISRVRTGAATAVAARRLARPESERVALVGTGTQAKTQLEALLHVLPLKRAHLVGRDFARTQERAAAIEKELQVEVHAFRSPQEALRGADVLVTATPSKAPLVATKDIPPGLFIAAVGADSPGKQELPPELLAQATVVADVLSQCIRVGELQHAIRAGLLTPERVHGELGAVLIGKVPGRTHEEEVTVYDSTGTALQDVALASALYQKAKAAGIGTSLNFGG